jgi:hypothetical protein
MWKPEAVLDESKLKLFFGGEMERKRKEKEGKMECKDVV